MMKKKKTGNEKKTVKINIAGSLLEGHEVT
jgi:hypothetical protein